MERRERRRRDRLGGASGGARAGRFHREPRHADRRVPAGGDPHLVAVPRARAARRRWRDAAGCSRLVRVTAPRDLVATAIRDALRRAATDRGWTGADVAVDVERPADPGHGDYASTVALKLARPLRKSPREIAEEIRSRVATGDGIAAVEVAGHGFINVRLDTSWLARQVDDIVSAGTDFGRLDALKGQRIQVEFVSANPTGPLTLGNARGGPLGDVLSSLLAFAGAAVTREYYVEDGGTQVKHFGESIAVRYRQLLGENVELSPEGYPADYVKDLAAQIKQRDGDRYRSLSLEEQGKIFAKIGIDWVVEDAQRVMAKLGIRFDEWFRQSSFIESGYFQKTIDDLRRMGRLVDRDGAVWFDAPEMPEDKEGWVVIRSNGDPLYLGTDIAYHRLCLFERGFDKKIDVWGANTHYHLVQMKVALAAFDIDERRWEVVLYQYVRFLNEGVIQRMGKRTGQFLLLEDVLDAVGVDATRFFLLQRSADAPLDFDLELAVQQSNDNPVYYVQYAHARIASIFRTAAERGLTVDGADVSALTSPAELDLVRLCLRFPELVAEVLEHKGVHLFTSYALELAGAFHSFYRDNRVVDEGDVPRSKARLRLVQAVQVALRQTLGLLGVSAPEKM
ncbi:MAG: arginine--tRNA ligase [Chloroflexi bacterium]|nr:MAG: arginine--tRNA ligase [Chloroflexota bacterium]TMG36089.1 MAG: arginine--tRNA ligase [Chloroflexota bacterium]